jgi:multicomponent Na+:H+ antiporter subunit D
MILLVGPLLYLFLRGTALKLAVLAVPVLSFAHLWSLPLGHELGLTLFGYELTPVRVDKLSMVWGTVYHIAAVLSALYGLHEQRRSQQIAAATYAGCAIAAAFAGDLITLFVFWELTALTSVFLIWGGGSARSIRAAARYLLIQIGSGVLLLAGVLIHFSQTGSLDFGAIGTTGLGGKLIFLAFGIKCAFPLLHNWLQDSYPEASPTGAVVLSAFTTKLAVYALARGFAGTEALIPIGAAMTLFPIVFAVIENDLRRVLAYSLNNQLGFMVVGVGIGTELALNGAAAHAFAHIIYKGLLFMAMGAVLHRVGTVKATELGGLYKSMPLTTLFCIIGSLSISGFPLFSGFVTKSMTLTAAADTQVVWLTLVLLVASAGVVDHSGIKIPFFAFFAHDSGKRVKEAPWHMLLAMGGMAAICIGIGLYPEPLYAMLPYEVDYAPYTPSHVLTSLQLLLFAALAFSVMWRLHNARQGGLMTLLKYPPELRGVNLDTDWVYRRGLPWLGRHWFAPALSMFRLMRDGAYDFGALVTAKARQLGQPGSQFGEPWPVGHTTLWAVLALGLSLFLAYLRV